MKKKIKQITAFVLVLALSFTTALSVSVKDSLNALQDENFSDDDFNLVTENDVAELHYNSRNALFRVISKESGQFYDTKAMNAESGNATTQNAQRSDLVFNYIANIDTGLRATTDTYSMSISNNQYETEEIENGLKINYTLGEETITLQDLPKSVPEDKMFELVISHLTAEQRESLESQYVLTGGNFLRRNDQGVAQLMINRLYSYFFEIGEYTLEDLAEDNAAAGYEEEAVRLEIQASLEYRLEGKDLVVTFPVDEFSISGESLLSTVDILPYAMSSPAGAEENGYMVIPDGSGGVIEFDNGRLTMPDYLGRVYGKDVLRDPTVFDSRKYNLTLPMTAIKYDDFAVIGIIEEGAEIASLNAQVSGKVDEFNKTNFRFNLLEIEQVETVGGSNVTLPRWSEDNYQGNITIRYRLIDEGDFGTGEVDYVQIASAYQEYLLETDQLIAQEIAEEATLALDFLGSIRKRQFFLGIPYNTNVSLTTFEQVQNIITELQDAGINNINAELTGFASGGLRQKSINNLSLLGVVGGNSGFEDLQDFASDRNGVNLYPSFYFTQAHNPGFISRFSDFARRLSGEQARLPLQNFVDETSSIESSSPYLISPLRFESYITEFLDSADDFELNGISVLDLGNRIVADYNSNNDTNRISAMEYVEPALAKLGEEFDNLLLSNPNAYAFNVASAVTDLPIDDNGYAIFNYEIPFVQLVFNGVIDYSGESLNNLLNTEPETIILKSIEYNMSPKFDLSAVDREVFKDTDFEGLINTSYLYIKENIIDIYTEYAEFYQEVAGASVETHVVNEDNTRVVTYDNGVTVYINYSDAERTVDGVSLEPLSYEIVN